MTEVIVLRVDISSHLANEETAVLSKRDGEERVPAVPLRFLLGPDGATCRKACKQT
jgi:hypothetical protein